jgi:D-inositol-3-phosphate glycosyltransferase
MSGPEPPTGAVQRAAVFSMHTSPLAQPGAGDGGGMNVYVRALASALARAGVACDVYTRSEDPGQQRVIDVEPGFRVVHVEAGPQRPVPRFDLPGLVDEFIDATTAHLDAGPPVDVLHGNYWLSGAVAHQLKHRRDLPMVATFHTLARVKADAGIDDDPDERARVEHDVINCADLMLASTESEREQLVTHYGAVADRVEIVPPGVDHSVFFPDDATLAKKRLDLDGKRTLLFAGRIQPLKGVGLAVRCLAELRDPDATLLVVGGPSGPDGHEELARVRDLAHELGVAGNVHFVPPQPHTRLADFYRAADVCIVPSRAESFGLVALEAAACGTPVVAASVGGLRSLVDDGVTGFLVDDRDPAAYAAPVAMLLEDPALAAEIGASASARSRTYSWSITAARLRRLYGDLVARGLVRCD